MARTFGTLKSMVLSLFLTHNYSRLSIISIVHTYLGYRWENFVKSVKRTGGNNYLFTQYLFWNEKKVSFDNFFTMTWEQGNKSERGKGTANSMPLLSSQGSLSVENSKCTGAYTHVIPYTKSSDLIGWNTTSFRLEKLKARDVTI